MGRLRSALVAVTLAAPFVVGAAVQAQPSQADRDANQLFRFADHRVNESSGLALVDGLIVTVNDSGDSGRVFAVDPATGETVGVSTFTPRPRDIEALAPAGPGHVWVGDIGDNFGVRDHVLVTRVAVGRAAIDAGAGEPYRLVYPDGARDAEALLTHPQTGRLYVISKDVLGGRIHAAPEALDPDGESVLVDVGPAPAVVTDAAFAPSGEEVLVRNYIHAWRLSYPEWDVLERFELPDQVQGEGLAVDSEGRILISTEGRGTAVLRLP